MPLQDGTGTFYLSSTMLQTTCLAGVRTAREVSSRHFQDVRFLQYLVKIKMEP